MGRVREILGEKADGRRYSRTLRRISAILVHMKPGKHYERPDLAEDISKANYPEFSYRASSGVRYLSRGGVRRYASFAEMLGVLKQAGKGRVTRDPSFGMPATDGAWAQYLADRAKPLLSSMLKLRSAASVEAALEKHRKALHRQCITPTLDQLCVRCGIVAANEQERFRWALSLLTDGPLSRLDIRRYPHLCTKE